MHIFQSNLATYPHQAQKDALKINLIIPKVMLVEGSEGKVIAEFCSFLLIPDQQVVSEMSLRIVIHKYALNHPNTLLHNHLAKPGF